MVPIKNLHYIIQYIIVSLRFVVVAILGSLIHWPHRWKSLVFWAPSQYRPSYLRMAISMLKIRRPLGRLIFNMGIAIPGKTVFLIETAPWKHVTCGWRYQFHQVQVIIWGRSLHYKHFHSTDHRWPIPVTDDSPNKGPPTLTFSLL